MLSELAKLPNTSFFDVHDVFCEEGWCGPWIPGTQLGAWQDPNHLSREGSFSLWPHVCRIYHETDCFGAC